MTNTSKLLAATAAAPLTALRADAATDPLDVRIQKILEIVRLHLQMDVGFLSEFVDGRRMFRHVDADTTRTPVAVGDPKLLEESNCHWIVSGRLPELSPDTTAVPAAAALPVTKAVPIKAYLSVPLRLPDGPIYGMLCCFNVAADETLNVRNLATLRAFADIMAEFIYADLEAERIREEKRAQIASVVAEQRFEIRYQPIYRLSDDCLVGFEALTRFLDQPYRTPDRWFAEASEAGMAVDLEFAAIRKACEGLPFLPHGSSLALNLSPSSVLTSDFANFFTGLPLERIILEITEHAAVADYAALAAVLRSFRQRGLRLAVDDAGAGHASFRHVLDLRPDIIKLDMSLTRDLDQDSGRSALAKALTVFGHAVCSQVVAEGVETRSELEALRAIGITHVQGYLMSLPLQLAEAAALPAIGVPIKVEAKHRAAWPRETGHIWHHSDMQLGHPQKPSRL